MCETYSRLYRPRSDLLAVELRGSAASIGCQTKIFSIMLSLQSDFLQSQATKHTQSPGRMVKHRTDAASAACGDTGEREVQVDYIVGHKTKKKTEWEKEFVFASIKSR